MSRRKVSRRKATSGRVTPRGTQPDAPNQHRGGPSAPRPLRARGREAPEASARYSPPTNDCTVRPRWHRGAGWVGVGFGALIAILNDAMLLGDDLIFLPFGHSELYLFLGVLVAGWSTRLLGLFDRDTVYV